MSMRTADIVVREQTESRGIVPTIDFETVMRDNVARIFNSAYCMLGNKQDAEDVTQEVFLRVYKALPDFESRSSLSTWLFRITMNTVSGFIKKNPKKPSLIKCSTGFPFLFRTRKRYLSQKVFKPFPKD